MAPRKRTKRWKTRGGELIPTCDLSDEHLLNILKMLERIVYPDWDTPRTAQYLRDEACDRGLMDDDEVLLWGEDHPAGYGDDHFWP